MTIVESAQERSRRNRMSKTNKPLTGRSGENGIAGEIAFARRILGIKNYRPRTRAPTQGYQFTVDDVWTIKVVTSETPGHLFVKSDKVNAMIYVLAGISGEPTAENVRWIGWAPDVDVRAAPVTTPTQGETYVQPAHSIDRDQLRPIAELCRIIGATGSEATKITQATATHTDDRVRDKDPSSVQGDLFK